MRVIMLGWELPPYNSGGLGIACHGLCEALVNSGADIEFILPYTADHQIDFMTIRSALPSDVVAVQNFGNSYESYKYIYRDNSYSWHDLFGHQQAYEKSIGELKFEESFDVIHAHDWLTFRAALKLKQIHDVPVFLHVHSIESDRAGGSGGNPLVREIEEMSLNLADGVIAVSQHTKDLIVKEYGVPPENIEVVHNSITPKMYDRISSSENAYKVISALKKQDYKVVVNIGRLTVQKGLTNLIRAFRKVHDYNNKTLLLIAGSGEQKIELLELAAELGVSRNVFFVDFVRGKKWHDTYAIGDIFVMPSVSEPFGLTPLESILHGTPAIVSKQSGIAEVVSNVLKVDFWDVDKLASQIINVFAYPSLATELQANAIKEVQNMGWHTSAQKVSDTYKKAIPTGVIQ
jgi:glycogen synthase